MIPENSPSGRRDFLKMSGLLTSGAFLAPAFSWASYIPNYLEPFSVSSQEYLTPFIVMEKTVRLASGSVFIGSDLQYALTASLNRQLPGNVFYYGMNIPFSAADQLNALQRLKEGVSRGGLTMAQSQRLALLSGGLVSKSVRETLAPGEGEFKRSGFDATEAKTLQDAILLTVFLSTGKSFKGESDPVANLFKEMLPRTFTRFHTIIPDEELGPEWVIRMQDWRIQNEHYYHRLASTLSDRETSQLMEMGVKHGFIGNAEPILNKVSTFSDTDDIQREEADSLIQASRSITGKALARGYNALIKINDFWNGQVTAGSLSEELSLKG